MGADPNAFAQAAMQKVEALPRVTGSGRDPNQIYIGTDLDLSLIHICGASIWDTFSHTPGKTKGGDTGDVACNSYHRWAEDIEIMKAMHLQAYRFSIAWPRIFPAGTGAVNPAGLAWYDRFVDALLAAGIEPYVTLYHWDLPQACLLYTSRCV